MTKKFINNPNYQYITAAKLTLSKIFDLYAVDFGDIVTFINKYSIVNVNKNGSRTFKDILNEKNKWQKSLY